MQNNIFVPYSEDIVLSTFVERPNRFIIRCLLHNDTGEIVEAHLADPGRLKELLLPGKKVYLLPSNNPNRKTRYSAVIVEREDGEGWVSINSTLPNALAELALKSNYFNEFENWHYKRAEFTMGKSRWDFLMSHTDGRQMAIEVKGASLVIDGKGFFPDAVTTRGAKHVKELASIAKERGWMATLLFIAQRDDISILKPAEHIDPNFAKAMQEAKEAGVQMIGCCCSVSPAGIGIAGRISILV